MLMSRKICHSEVRFYNRVILLSFTTNDKYVNFIQQVGMESRFQKHWFIPHAKSPAN